jgi:hypothetical protein
MLRGNEMLITKRMMMARRSVRSQRIEVSARDGKRARKTVGRVSPIIMQKASMPPKALSDHVNISIHFHSILFSEEEFWEVGRKLTKPTAQSK